MTRFDCEPLLKWIHKVDQTDTWDTDEEQLQMRCIYHNTRDEDFFLAEAQDLITEYGENFEEHLPEDYDIIPEDSVPYGTWYYGWLNQ